METYANGATISLRDKIDNFDIGYVCYRIILITTHEILIIPHGSYGKHAFARRTRKTIYMHM